MAQVWVVRAGKAGADSDVAFKESVVGVGWSELVGLPSVASEEELRARLAEAYPDEGQGARSQSFGQLRTFLFTINVGDLVLLPTSGGTIHVGEVTGPVQERPELPAMLRFTRSVNWIGSFNRAAVQQDLVYSLNGLQTVFGLNRGGDEKRIRQLAAGDADTGATDQQPQKPPDKARFGRVRTFDQVFALAQVLAEQRAPISPSDALEWAKEYCPPLEAELTFNKSGNERFTHNLRWWSVELSKIGWMSKGDKGGQWSITEGGKQALEDFPDAQLFGAEMHKQYREVVAQEKKVAEEARKAARLERLVGRVPAGRWASLSDVEPLIGLSSPAIVKFLSHRDTAGWHRLLHADGTIETDGVGGPDREGEQRELLLEDGLSFDGRAPASARLSVAELSALVSDEPIGQRAWLVKGASVSGRDLVPYWIDDGFVSLPGTSLPTMAPPIEREAVQLATDAAFSGRASDYRRRKFEDYDRFLRRMQAGDFVVTASKGQLFVGRVEGSPEWVDSGSSPSRIRRTVTWDLSEGLEQEEAPKQLTERLQNADDVTDLTEVLEVIEKILSDAIDADPNPQVALAAPTTEFADGIHLPQAWLAHVVQLLERRKQIIFYGPPGTGKTFLAQELAEYLTEPSNVQLVQFHPSYSYEDFIQGFRPELSESGQPVFSLRQGPLMKIAEKARDDATTPHFLIIDEINRANLAKVFGELYFLLEYRNRRIDTLYSEGGNDKFSLPDNLFIIGTMNTADRSIALVDAAMRRRFAFEALHPSQPHIEQMLRTWQEQNHPDGFDAAALLAELNSRLDDRDYAIGPSYFMKDWIYTDPDGLTQMWNSDIIPLLEEHHAGDGIDVEDVYGLDRLLRAVDTARNAAVDDYPGSSG